MESLPHLSVVLPIYNGGLYLQEAVQSVLDQTYENFELIAINDGSTDNSLAILQAFHDPRLHIFTQSNQGLIATLRRGVDLAHAPLIARMDQDDICLPHRFSTQVNFMNKHPEVGVCGGAVILDEYGQQRVLNFPSSDAEIRWNLCYGSPIVHPTVVFRKSVYQEVNGYQQSVEAELSEDYDLWTRMAPITKFANIYEPVLILRKHGENMTLTSSVKHLKQSQGVSLRYVQHILKHTVPLADIATMRYESSQPENTLSASIILKQLYDKFRTSFATNIDDLKSIEKDFFYRILHISSLSSRWKNKAAVYKLTWKASPSRTLYYLLRRSLGKTLAFMRKNANTKNKGLEKK